MRGAVAEINSKRIPVKLDAPELADGKSVISAAEDANVATGLYFPIGSFSGEVNAQKLGTLCPDLTPRVMPVEYQGKFFGIMAGPVRVGQKPSLQRKIKAAEFYDA
jgi:hypothetical protein